MQALPHPCARRCGKAVVARGSDNIYLADSRVDFLRAAQPINMPLGRLLLVCSLVLGARAFVGPSARARPLPLAARRGSSDGDASTAVASVSLTASLAAAATLWSEATVAATGCGPVLLPDALERFAYIVVIGVSGASSFSRIAFGESAYTMLVGELQPGAARWADRLLLVCVAGACLAHACQVANGQQLSPDALSGIDELYCAAVR